MKRMAVLRRYAAGYRESRTALLWGVLLSMARALVLVPVPLLVGRAIDVAIPGDDVGGLVAIGGAVVALTIGGAVISVMARRVTVAVTKQAIEEMRIRAVDILLRVSRRFYSAADHAALHDKVVTETGRVDTMNSAIFEDILPGIVLVLGVTVVLFSMDPMLTLVTLAFGPIMFITGRFLGRRLRGDVRLFHRAVEQFSDSTLRLVRAMDLIRTQASEDVERDFQAERIGSLREASSARAVSSTIYGVTQQAIIAIAGAAVLILGGIGVIREAMTLGDLLAFYAGFAIMRGPLASLAARGPALIEGMQSLHHLEELLDEVDQSPYTGTTQVDVTDGIRLERVSFAYADEPVIRDVSFAIGRGEVAALLGPNGSGKSTIVNLVLGFYAPDEGALFVGDTRYEHVDIRGLRRDIGVVPQQPLLLAMSVRDNITFGRPDIDDGAVHDAITAARADFIRDLPAGLDTPVGEGGVFISGGQRQRIAIARALVHRPRLVILDEPTNHLDQEAVEALLDGVAAFDEDLAILLISHRTEVLDHVDSRILLEAGRVADLTFSAASEDREFLISLRRAPETDAG